MHVEDLSSVGKTRFRFEKGLRRQDRGKSQSL
jgi:hypothetical protein